MKRPTGKKLIDTPPGPRCGAQRGERCIAGDPRREDDPVRYAHASHSERGAFYGCEGPVPAVSREVRAAFAAYAERVRNFCAANPGR